MKKGVDKDKIRDAIERAFPQLPLPTGRIVVSPPGRNPEADQIQHDLGQRIWKELSLEEVRRNAASPFFMTPSSALYFLPAYLIALLEPDETEMASFTTLELLEQV